MAFDPTRDPLAGGDQTWVPITWVFDDSIPAPVARLLRDVADLLEDRGELTPDTRWQSLEWAAAELMGSLR